MTKATFPALGKILEQIFSDAPEYLVVLDESLTVRIAGAAFREALGVDESAEPRFLDSVEPFSASHARQVFEDLRSDERGHKTLDVHHRGPDGTTFGVAYSWVACRDKENIVRAFVGIGRDLVETQEAAEDTGALANEMDDLRKDVQRRTIEIGKLRKQLESQATSDGLTGLGNRQHVLDRLEGEAARAVRYGSPLTILLAEVDNFAQINESHGTARGDEVLLAVAETIRNQIRASDLPARFDSAQFMVLCPHTDRANAQFLAQRLRRRVAEMVFPGGEEPFAATISIGLVTVTSEEPLKVEEILAAAHQALETAKMGGVNRVKVFDVS